MGDKDYQLKVNIIRNIRGRPLIYNKAHLKHYIHVASEREVQATADACGVTGE